MEDYRLRRGDNIGDPNVLNARFEDIDTRIWRQEDIEKDWSTALENLQNIGLEKVNEVLFPVYQRIVELAQLGAMFTAHSATEIEISTGLKRLTIDEDERDSFAPAAFIAAFVEEDISQAILGEVQGYNRNSGELTIFVHRVAGSGNGANWIIHAASATDNAEAAAEALAYKEAAESARDIAAGAATTAVDARDEALFARHDASAFRDEVVAARNTTVSAKDTVLANLAEMDQYYLGAHETDPITDNQGGALLEGTQYFNLTAKELRVWKGIGTGWVVEYVPADSSVASIFGRTGAVGAADGDYHASQVVFTPAGGLAATRVQAALAELDTEKAAKSTTLAGYAIADAYTKTEIDDALADKADAATTLAGYGIVNAYTKSEIDSAIAARVQIASIVNTLTSTATDAPLSAAQGKALKDLIDGLGDVIVVADVTARNALTGLDVGDLVHVIDDGAGKWVRYQVTAAGAGTWASATKVAIWTQDQAPATHQHTIADVTNLQTSLNSIWSAIGTKADSASPTLTGTPTAPTAAAGTNTTQLATTAYVLSMAADTAPVMDGTAAIGSSTRYARQDHVHPTDTSRVPTARAISTAGLATGGGNLTADRTITVTAAAAADMRTGTDNTKALTAAGAWNAMGIVTLTDGATITPNFSSGIDFAVSLGGNRTLANPVSPKVGQKGRIRVNQDGTGSRTLAFGSAYKWAGGSVGVLSTAAWAVDCIDYDVIASDFIRVSLSKGWA